MFLFLSMALAHDPLIDAFDSIDELLPTPSEIRTATGRPGAEYWQQQVDYVIDVKLDAQRQQIIGSEVITYHNNSPEERLTYGCSSTKTTCHRPRRLIASAPHRRRSC